MKSKDLLKVKAFYENVIMQQIIKPQDINEIYLLVKPEGTPVPYYQKMRVITTYMQGLQQEVLDSLEELLEDDDDKDDVITNDPRLSTYVEPTVLKRETSSKSEDMPPEQQSHQEDISDYEKYEDFGAGQAMAEEIKELEAEYLIAKTANEKRSITMKIKAIKKKLK